MAFHSEEHILDILARSFPVRHPSLLLGRGDDCAVLRSTGSLCLSSDLFLEDVHFRRAYFKPEEVGHKALAVNISDIAAMGVKPVGFTLALGLPADVSMEWLERFFQGMASLASHHRMVLAGGDLSRAASVHVSITVWGEGSGGLRGQGPQCAADVRGHSPQGPGGYLTRGGGMPGDALFVVGSLGLARTGLSVLEEMGHAARELWPAACAAHLKPLPCVDAGQIIGRAGITGRPPVLMDLSDGLSRDLPRLLGLRGDDAGPLGAQVLLPAALLHHEVIRHAREKGLCPVTEAWLGGEDYALLGACAPELLPALHAALPTLQSIGLITEGGGICCNGDPAPGTRGFDHFTE